MSTPIGDVTDSNAEPVLKLAGGYVGAATAVFALVEAFGFDLSSKQQGAIVGIIPLVLFLVAAFHIRSKVFSPKTVAWIAASPNPVAAAKKVGAPIT